MATWIGFGTCLYVPDLGRQTVSSREIRGSPCLTSREFGRAFAVTVVCCMGSTHTFLCCLVPLRVHHSMTLSTMSSSGFLAEVVAKRSLCSESHASEVQDVWNVRLRLFAEPHMWHHDALGSFQTHDMCHFGLSVRFSKAFTGLVSSRRYSKTVDFEPLRTERPVCRGLPNRTIVDPVLYSQRSMPQPPRSESVSVLAQSCELMCGFTEDSPHQGLMLQEMWL